MKNKVRFTNAKGETFESVTEGSSDEILAVFGQDFRGLLAPMNRLQPTEASALSPTPAPQYHLPQTPAHARTVVQAEALPEDPIDDRLRELEQEVEDAHNQHQWQPCAPTVVSQPPIPASSTPAYFGGGNPAIQLARGGAAKLLQACRNPWFWFDCVIFPVILLSSLPATRPMVEAVPLVGKPIASGVNGVVKGVFQPQPTQPNKPSPAPKENKNG